MSLLGWIVSFLILGLILSVFGFDSASEFAFGGAKLLFTIVVIGFVILFVLFLVGAKLF
jgi:uncharacterized membrane protein YtjA (UPF0391 family)